MVITKSMNLITLHFRAYLAFKQWDVNIVAHHPCKPKHHLIPQLVASNKVFECWQVKHIEVKNHKHRIPKSPSHA